MSDVQIDRITRAGRAWLSAYAVATFLAFPHPVGDRVIDLGVVFAWLSPACLLLGLRGLSPLRAARAAFVASWLAHAAILHWIYVVTVVYGGAPRLLGVLAPLALALYFGLHGAIFGGAWAWLVGRGLGSPLAAAALFVVVEHLRGFLFTGFPWAWIGYAQHGNALLLPLAASTGVHGLGFVTALGGAALASFATARMRGEKPPRSVLVIALAIVSLHALGLASLLSSPPKDEAIAASRTLRVAAIQGSIEQDEKWRPDHMAETFDLYERLSRRAIADGARLVVWPETAIPLALELDVELASRLTALARETRTAFVVGAVGVDVDRAAGEISHFYDSAFVFDAAGRFVARYDKSHLVPFGEYVPLRGLLGGLFDAVARGIAEVDVSAGAGPRALPVDLGPPVGFVRLGIPICYELLFPDRMRGFAADGAQLLVAITNDAWYGRTGAPHQFLAITALRSVESGLWTVRAANTGVSAFIDDRGRIGERSRLFEPAVLVADVPLVGEGERAATTPYVRHGDLLVAACWLGLVGLFGVALRRGRAASRGGRERPVRLEE